MPSFELSKLQGVTPPRALGESERTQLQARQSDLPTPPAPRPSGEKPGVSVEVNELASAGSPPVNNERVSEIRDALKNGSYPLVPTQIADAMIAARISLTIPGGEEP